MELMMSAIENRGFRESGDMVLVFKGPAGGARLISVRRRPRVACV